MNVQVQFNQYVVTWKFPFPSELFDILEPTRKKCDHFKILFESFLSDQVMNLFLFYNLYKIWSVPPSRIIDYEDRIELV